MFRLEITLIKPDAAVYDLYKAIGELEKNPPVEGGLLVGVITDPYDDEPMAVWQIKEL